MLKQPSAKLADTSLSEGERAVLDAIVSRLEHELGPQLRAIWLYGSRARGELPGPESDIDLLVVVTESDPALKDRIQALAWDTAEGAGEDPLRYAVLVWTAERVAERRAIRSFFMQEVDRDRVVLAGDG